MSSSVEGEIAETMKRLRSLGDASVRGTLHNFGAYPGAVLAAPAATLIHGELFELPDDESTLTALDKYEDFDPLTPEKCLFVRRRTTITGANGQSVQGWIYVYNGNPDSAPIIQGGKWSNSR